MPNTIVLAKNYTSLLDEVYKKHSVTADLIAPAELVRAGSNAKFVLYPMVSVNGLGDYDRNSGYTDGSVNVSWEEITFDKTVLPFLITAAAVSSQELSIAKI